MCFDFLEVVVLGGCLIGGVVRWILGVDYFEGEVEGICLLCYREVFFGYRVEFDWIILGVYFFLFCSKMMRGGG